MCDACNFALRGLQLQDKSAKNFAALTELYALMGEAVKSGNTDLEREMVDSALVLFKDMIMWTNDSIRMKSLFDAQTEVCVTGQKFKKLLEG